MKMEITAYVVFLLLAIGMASGMLSGFVGVGGGLIIVPALVYFLGYTQLQAQGTSLAVLLLPVGFLAVMHYYKQGNVNTTAALLIGAGFILGALFGSKFAHNIPIAKVKFGFALIMLVAALKLLYESSKVLFSSN
jgi:uncharacterized membrane protein YfcA